MPQDPFALNITITLLLLSLGMGMFVGSAYAYIKRKERDAFYMGRTVFLIVVGLLISIWSILSF
jgi:uncharacterized membrane protein